MSKQITARVLEIRVNRSDIEVTLQEEGFDKPSTFFGDTVIESSIKKGNSYRFEVNLKKKRDGKGYDRDILAVIGPANADQSHRGSDAGSSHGPPPVDTNATMARQQATMRVSGLLQTRAQLTIAMAGYAPDSPAYALLKAERDLITPESLVNLSSVVAGYHIDAVKPETPTQTVSLPPLVGHPPQKTGSQSDDFIPRQDLTIDEQRAGAKALGFTSMVELEPLLGMKWSAWRGQKTGNSWREGFEKVARAKNIKLPWMS